MARSLLVALISFVLSFSVAQAAPNTPPAQATNSDTSTSSTAQPDLLSFGAGYYDFDKGKDQPKTNSADFRLEYRWGLSILPLVSNYFSSWDKYIQFHPYVGFETTSRGMTYGSGGWAMDGYIGRHGIFTWSEGVGLYQAGDSHSLGSFVEFRSMAELGWRFDNNMRITAALSHISNAGLTKHNNGAEIAGMYLHVPVSLIAGTLH